MLRDGIARLATASAILAMAIPATRVDVAGAQAASRPAKFALDFPLKCGDPSCSFPYSDGAQTPNSINSVLDHSLKQGSNGSWQYGSVGNGSADGAIVAADGSRFSGRTKAGDLTCISGAFVPRADRTARLSGLVNHSGCGNGFISYDEHPGYDYRASVGTPVFAAAPGKIVDVSSQRCVLTNIQGSCDAWGYVGIDHGNGYITQYGHLGRVDVQAGDLIGPGQQLGLTGRKAPVALGAHLHFEVLYKFGDEYLVVDPYGWSGLGINPLYSAKRVPSEQLWKSPSRTAIASIVSAVMKTPFEKQKIDLVNRPGARHDITIGHDGTIMYNGKTSTVNSVKVALNRSKKFTPISIRVSPEIELTTLIGILNGLDPGNALEMDVLGTEKFNTVLARNKLHKGIYRKRDAFDKDVDILVERGASAGSCFSYMDGFSLDSQQLLDRLQRAITGMVTSQLVTFITVTRDDMPSATIRAHPDTPWKCVAGAYFVVRMSGIPTLRFSLDPNAQPASIPAPAS